MNKKELIRQSAIELFAQDGYYNTTVKMVSKKAGIAVGTVYNYFANKEEILEYIFEVELTKRIRFLEELKNKDISFQQKARLFLDKHFSELEAKPTTTTVLTQECRLPSENKLETVEKFMNQIPALIAQLLEQAKEKGEIREINSKLVANAIFNSLQGMAIKVSRSEEYNFAQAKKELLNLYWLGLKR
ncbi:TetR/AcrR family transcriptional regulator [Natroniella sulfidigena]|uniref:TetR/AcrR family transcriptional regulator n=1 Tax=Natroniella sulfidigena TaxID=723921 RepID=UPI00200ADE8C|nr:TetR/AcrR family transcriptional regulator [Natroniella sulfidigena]MCK8817780.1 TetR/AcrR family transcriptional regulator [Natroniella sulfidigena]